MNIEQLAGSAKAKAMETISNLMKDHKEQYGQFCVDDMKQFTIENNFEFDHEGNLI